MADSETYGWSLGGSDPCDNSAVHVRRLVRSPRGTRSQYGYAILNESEELIDVGTDSGPRAMLASLCGFLGAFAEARDEYSDNWSLFGDHVREWAQSHSDELTIAQRELEES